MENVIFLNDDRFVNILYKIESEIKADSKLEDYEEGILEGINETKLVIARRMKYDKFENELICKYTGLSPQRVDNL